MYSHMDSLLPQTSLIPVTVSLVRHLEANGLSSFFSNYPYWYLGSTPFKYLIGPVVPVLELFIKAAFPFLNFFDISALLIVLSYLVGIAGWVAVALHFRLLKNKYDFLYIILLIILPWRMVYSWGLGETTFVIARNLLPCTLWLCLKQKGILISILICLILLINSSVLSLIFIGLLAVSTVNGFKDLQNTLKRVAIGILLATVWYGIGYWLAILTNPSIGGGSGIQVIFKILQIVRDALPVGLAFLTVFGKKRNMTGFEKFVYAYTASFLFLTLFRFISDMDYWSDWTTYFYELEVAIVFLAVINRKYLFLGLISIYAVYRLIPQIAVFYNLEKVLGDVYQITGPKTTFFSGSTVFWANAYYDFNQLRGGRDQVALHPAWDKAAYQLREGNELRDSVNYLNSLNIKYVLVHTDSSAEYYKDFRNVYKWSKVGIEVWNTDGDILYEVKK